MFRMFTFITDMLGMTLEEVLFEATTAILIMVCNRFLFPGSFV